ncbi:MAG: hypothetical protein O3A46_05805 [Candidatus Poribacteria bacterium]|nr:hypothetical protein [Candidatus Poribacteria bacterium]
MGANRTLLLAVDWTKWLHGLQMLLGSVIVQNRAIPVQTHVTPD